MQNENGRDRDEQSETAQNQTDPASQGEQDDQAQSSASQYEIADSVDEDHADRPADSLSWLVQAQQQVMLEVQLFSRQNQMVLERVMNLNACMISQTNQLGQNHQDLKKELQKFQTGGPQRAMTAVYIKLFRDLITHLNHMDDLISSYEKSETINENKAWAESLLVLRRNLESILKEWGVTPIPIQVGKESFNPEFHEAVPPMAGDIPESAPVNIIFKICRRGWALCDTILQYPQVVAS